MHQPDITPLKPEQQESIENLKTRIADDDVVVIDVRNPDEVERSGKIAAKRWLNIPYPEVENALGLSLEDFKSKYNIEKPKDGGAEIVFHCGKGGRGTKAVVVANRVGYDEVKNLDGGQSTWKRSF